LSGKSSSTAGCYSGKRTEGRLKMVGYRFYLDDGSGESDLIGILPERRKNPRRRTWKSIMKWGRLVAGSYVDPGHIHFVRIEL
jgi:hypothetical protein